MSPTTVKCHNCNNIFCQRGSTLSLPPPFCQKGCCRFCTSLPVAQQWNISNCNFLKISQYLEELRTKSFELFKFLHYVLVLELDLTSWIFCAWRFQNLQVYHKEITTTDNFDQSCGSSCRTLDKICRFHFLILCSVRWKRIAQF